MGGSRPTKPQRRTNIPFDLDEIARYEKWGHYMAASTTNNETAQKVRVTLLLAKVGSLHGIPQCLPAYITLLPRLKLYPLILPRLKPYPVKGALALVIATGQAILCRLCSVECITIPHTCKISAVTQESQLCGILSCSMQDVIR